MPIGLPSPIRPAGPPESPRHPLVYREIRPELANIVHYRPPQAGTGPPRYEKIDRDAGGLGGADIALFISSDLDDTNLIDQLLTTDRFICREAGTFSPQNAPYPSLMVMR